MTSIRPDGWTLTEWREDVRRQGAAYDALGAAVLELERRVDAVILYRTAGKVTVLTGGDTYHCDPLTFELLAGLCSDLRPAGIVAGSPQTN